MGDSFITVPIFGEKMHTIKTNFEKKVNKDQIQQAAKILDEGGIVAFPTETVYGLGGDALNPKAVGKIFEAKGRPQDNPLIIHVADDDLSQFVQSIPEKAKELMDKFWPGPLTIILKKTSLVPMETSGGLNSIGVRKPSNPIAQELIKALGRPIAAPSANLSGKPSPTTFERCVEDLSGRVDMIIGDGQSILGLESTIVDYSVSPPRLLRPGYITLEELIEVDRTMVYDEEGTRVGDDEAPKAPGMKYRHYAPKAPMTIILGDKDMVIKKMVDLVSEAKNKGLKIGVLAPDERKPLFNEFVTFISLGAEQNLREMGRNLFEGLRQCDDMDVDVIFAEGIEEAGIGKAVMNRLKKASGFQIIEV